MVSTRVVCASSSLCVSKLYVAVCAAMTVSFAMFESPKLAIICDGICIAMVEDFFSCAMRILVPTAFFHVSVVMSSSFPKPIRRIRLCWF